MGLFTERFFRSLKNEWVPMTGYISFSEAAHVITDYIVGNYSEFRLHEYNCDYHQTNQKTDTEKTLKPWSVLVDHYITLITIEFQKPIIPVVLR